MTAPRQHAGIHSSPPPPALKYGCTIRSSDKPERYGLLVNALPSGAPNRGSVNVPESPRTADEGAEDDGVGSGVDARATLVASDDIGVLGATSID